LSVALEETAKYLSVRAETSDGSNGTAVVTVAPLITVTLDSVTADGSSTSATTKLTLTFNKAVAGLTASNITLSAGTTGAQKGALSGSGTSWTFEVSGITADGQVTVSVGTQPTGYSITGSASATVYKGITAASLSSVSANGSSTTATTKLTLTFSQDITGLSKDHITLSGSTGAVKGALSKVIGTGKYELTVSNITADGQVTVSVVSQPSGYNITGSASANVYKGITSVTMTVTQVGGSSTATTTALTLSFSPGIANLALGEITISTGSTGAVKGTLLGSNTSYTLELTGIKADGSITVSVNKAGYSVASKTVTVYYGSKSLKQEFGVTSTGKQAVTDTFTEVSNFIKNGGLTSSQTRIQLGDYIDLEAGLSVAAYGSGEGAGAFSISAAEGSKAITTTASQSDNPNYRGALLRLIVVGINSFNGKNGNNKDHVVFHFQNIPVTRRMNSNDTNSGGYAASEMRKYLTPVSGYSDSGKFLTGLTNAGVPDSVLWAPKRMMSTEYSGSGTTQIEDKLWLPTEREMFGNGLYSNSSAETAANQARLDYYYNGGTGAYSRRVKYSSGSFNSSGAVTSNGESAYYWQASPYNSGPYFCGVHEHGHSGHYGNASGAWGCVPAFCVSY
jgi:hypothetical protein